MSYKEPIAIFYKELDQYIRLLLPTAIQMKFALKIKKDMELKFLNKPIKAILAIACILGANQALARPATDKITICYGVNGQDKMSFKTPCIATNTGGAGIMILIYQINGKEYVIESSDDGDFINGKPYTTYLRDGFFNRVPDNSEAYSYYCYKSKAAHFCSQQNSSN